MVGHMPADFLKRLDATMAEESGPLVYEAQKEEHMAEQTSKTNRNQTNYPAKTDRPVDEGQRGRVARILNERGQRHGHFAVHSAMSQELKTAFHRCTQMRTTGDKKRSLTPYQQEAIEMILHKIARICAGDPDFHDHWDDIAGYATLVSELCGEGS